MAQANAYEWLMACYQALTGARQGAAGGPDALARLPVFQVRRTASTFAKVVRSLEGLAESWTRPVGQPKSRTLPAGEPFDLSG